MAGQRRTRRGNGADGPTAQFWHGPLAIVFADKELYVTTYEADTAPAEAPSGSFTELFAGLLRNIERVVQGKTEVVHLMLLCLFAEGHMLVEDSPGVGKTTLAKALASSVDVPFGRVQFTPDLLPSDVVGVSIWNRAESVFEFRPGPIFSGVVIADEINRTSPKTQSALLEAMAEGQVTADGQSRPLRKPFMVIATQNPLEHEGTYPLPESQLDRFLAKTSVGYPARSAEIDILNMHGTSQPIDDLRPVIDAQGVLSMIAAVKTVHVAPELQHYLVDLADATRRHPGLAIGISPRATLNMQNIIRARAASAGRNYSTPDDVKALAHPVLAHRLILTPEAQIRGLTAARVLDEVLQSVPVPRTQS